MTTQWQPKATGSYFNIKKGTFFSPSKEEMQQLGMMNAYTELYQDFKTTMKSKNSTVPLHYSMGNIQVYKDSDKNKRLKEIMKKEKQVIMNIDSIKKKDMFDSLKK